MHDEPGEGRARRLLRGEVLIPEGYRVAETQERVFVEPDIVTRFRLRAERRCRRLNARRSVPFYRWEVIALDEGRWAVVAMQNKLQAEHEQALREQALRDLTEGEYGAPDDAELQS